ncbi:hypothetical protein [Rhodobacter capsulatus]|uniref:hypothetical protein n=1 Tax=Rhodobacter capsulatus TaxID=1061 RepID=UPI00402A4AD8
MARGGAGAVHGAASERTDPSQMWSDLRRIGPAEPPMVGMAAPKAAMDSYAVPVAEAARPRRRAGWRWNCKVKP